MGDHPNAALVRKAMEAWMDGDMSNWVALIDDDIVWHEIGGTTITGKEALIERQGDMGDVEFSGGIHDIVGNDDHVIALVEANVKVGDRDFSYRTAEVYHVDDGKVTERWAMSDDTQAITEFFSGMGG